MKRRVCVVTGNRSEYAYLKPVLSNLKNRDDIELILITTASHLLEDFGRTADDIKNDGFKIDGVAKIIIEGEDIEAMSKSIGLGILEISTLFSTLKPDVVLVGGDRFDIYPAAIAASVMNIPLAHIQGGEITGTIDESIRHSITKLSHIHFPATKKSAERIIKMGEKSDRVFFVGCPSYDTLDSVKYDTREEVCQKYNLDPKKPFLILLQHPVTTEFGQSEHQYLETLNSINEVGIQTILIYPNVDAGSVQIIRTIRKFKEEHPEINNVLNNNEFKHLKFEEFAKLLNHCDCLVGNSSSGMRQSCFFGTPVVNIGTRQQGREHGKNVTNVGYGKDEIKNAILKNIEHGKYPKESIYGNGDAGKKIAEILATIDISQIQKRITYGDNDE